MDASENWNPEKEFNLIMDVCVASVKEMPQDNKDKLLGCIMLEMIMMRRFGKKTININDLDAIFSDFGIDEING